MKKSSIKSAISKNFRQHDRVYNFRLVSILLITLVATNYALYNVLASNEQEYTQAVVNYPVEPDFSVLEALVDTPMEDAIPYIKKASKYYDIPPEAIVGIAFAESSFTKSKVYCYNAWGVDTGRGQDPRCYNNWEHGANGIAHLLRYYYFNEGKNTPETIVYKYVGKNWTQYHDQWVRNVRTYWK